MAKPIKMTLEMEAQSIQLITAITQSIIALEYSLENKSHMTQAETTQTEEQYENQKGMMIEMIMVEAASVGHPAKMKDWEDTLPITLINQKSDHQLAATDFYQELLGKIMLGQV